MDKGGFIVVHLHKIEANHCSTAWNASSQGVDSALAPPNFCSTVFLFGYSRLNVHLRELSFI